MKHTYLSVGKLPEHLITNKNWFTSFQINEIRTDGEKVIVTIWRKLGGKIIETTVEMELDETMTFADGM